MANIMLRLVPPAGIPVTILDVLKIILGRISSADIQAEFSKIIKNVAGAKYCWFINSGRAANYIILKTLRNISDSGRDEVVIPAYTCFSVPASIARAGLRIRLVDITPETMDYNYNFLDQADFSKSLALLPVNLFGIISDWTRLRGAVAGSSAYLIDDSAQTLGLSVNNIMCGSLGDIGFFSFGRGKNLTTYSGGAIVTNNDKIAESIEKQISELRQPGKLTEPIVLAEFIFYSIMMRPWLYWIPDSLPFLELGKTEYDEDFPVESLSKFQQAAGTIMYSKFSRITEIRIANANALANKINMLEGYLVPGWRENAEIPFIRLPILAPNSAVRDKVIGKLRHKGIAASRMYPTAINNILSIRELIVNAEDKFPGAEYIAERLFTLPTHSYLKHRDIETVFKCLAEIRK
jgi:perosamine synthetase